MIDKGMSFKKCKELIKKDSRRNGSVFVGLFKPLHALLIWFRLCGYFWSRNMHIMHLCTKVPFKVYQYITGVHLDERCSCGGGLHIEHHSNIAISVGATLGENVTLFQGVTIGKNFGGSHYGYPNIGDNVILFAGCKVLGKVRVGNNAVIGANSVVTKDVPDNCVVAGVPAKVVSEDFRTAIFKNEYEKHFKLKGY